MTYTFDEINDVTGFANGTKFTSSADVQQYFTVKAQKEMFPGDDIDSQDVLNEMAATVIRNKWHMVQEADTCPQS